MINPVNDLAWKALALLGADQPVLAEEHLRGLSPDQLVRLARASDDLAAMCLNLAHPDPPEFEPDRPPVTPPTAAPLVEFEL